MPKRVDHEERRRQIADALLRTAATRGLHAAGMREVAAEAGVSLRLVQYYFGTKEELLLAAMQHLAARFGARAVARFKQASGSGGPARPRDVIAAILAEALPADDDRRTFYVVYTAYLALSLTDPALAIAPLVKNSDTVTGVVAAQLRAAQAAGDAPPRLDPDLEALSLMAMSAGLATSVLAGQSSIQQAQAVIDYHLDRLFPPSRPALHPAPMELPVTGSATDGRWPHRADSGRGWCRGPQHPRAHRRSGYSGRDADTGRNSVPRGRAGRAISLTSPPVRGTRTKERQMTSNPRPGPRIVGSLRSAGGKGVVRIEDRYGTGIDDLWSALTDPGRLASWYGQVEGDLRLGGQFRLHVEDADSDATGRVEACEPPRRLQVTTRETEESYRRGKGVPPYDEALDATLTADGDQTILVIEVRGMPLDAIAFYGVGWQIHAENLAAYLAGRTRGDTKARWDDLVPAYQELAASIS